MADIHIVYFDSKDLIFALDKALLIIMESRDADDQYTSDLIFAGAGDHPGLAADSFDI